MLKQAVLRPVLLGRVRKETRALKTLLLAASLGVLAGQLNAGVMVHIGGDPAAGPGDPRPSSDGAAALFDSQASLLGPLDIIDFESLAQGDFLSMSIGPGVTATLSGTESGAGGIVADGWFGGFDPWLVGYNTTAGGEQFLDVVPMLDIGTVTVTFDFDIPIQAFGFYLTGFEGFNSGLEIELVRADGTSDSFSMSGLGDGIGGVNFVGVIDDGASMTRVNLTHTDILGDARDIYGVDDFRLVLIPAPPTVLVLALALAHGLGVRRRQR